MKIQLNVGEEFYEEIKEKLLIAEFEIDDEGPFLLSEKDRFASAMIVKNNCGDKVQIKTSDIIYAESCGHNVIIHTIDGCAYNTSERLYKIEARLDDMSFIRVSNCAIIAKKQIKKMKASLSMKIILTMSNGALVDVTRSYYNSFKSFMGI